MDIAKFNKELSYKVAKANGLEKHKKFQEAIDLWLDISEMALNASKTPNIAVYYKSMLIEKTKQIINHIKDLKSKLWDQKGRAQPLGQELIAPSQTSEETPAEELIENEIELAQSEPFENSSDTSETTIIENSDIENLPIGFKEIEAPEDFTIITPHDTDHIKKMLSQDHDMSVFTHDDKEVKAPDQNELKQPLDKTKVICFACGSELPANSKACRVCGTKLE